MTAQQQPASVGQVRPNTPLRAVSQLSPALLSWESLYRNFREFAGKSGRHMSASVVDGAGS